MLRPTGWYLATAPVDLRYGMDRLLVMVQSQWAHDALGGAAYVFRNRSGTRLKVLLADANAYGFAPVGYSQATSSGRGSVMRCVHHMSTGTPTIPRSPHEYGDTHNSSLAVSANGGRRIGRRRALPYENVWHAPGTDPYVRY